MSLHKNIKLLTWFNFFTDFQLYAPIAIIYFSRVAHSYALGASIFSITYIISAIFDIPTGIYADRIGRKRTVILGATCAVIYSIFLAIGINYWFLAIGAVFAGVSRAFYSGNNDALLHNLLAEEGIEEEYHAYSGKLSSAFQLALGVSGLLGAFIANWSFPAVMWLSVLPQLICLFIGLRITESTIRRHSQNSLWDDLREGAREFIHNSNLRLLGIKGTVGFALSENTYQFQAAFYNTLLPIWAVGLVKTISNVGATISFYFSGKVINKVGIRNIMLVGDIYSRLTNIAALIFPTILSPFLMSSNSLFYGTGVTASRTLMQKEFTDKQRATMSSLSSFAGSLLFGVVAFLTGVFADKLGPRDSLLIIQIIYLPLLWVSWKLIKINKIS